MAEVLVQRRPRLARFALLAMVPVVAALWLAFKLYEPFIAIFWGWKPVPALEYPLRATHAPGWEGAGTQADELLKIIREQTRAPAVSAAISIDGQVVWAGAVGYADYDRRAPATPETAFRIGSSSKAITSVAMGTLLDEGKVDLDAPVSRYVARLTGPLAPITTRQAMSHTAGIRDYGTCLCFPLLEYFNRSHFDTQRETLTRIEDSPLLFEPGKEFSYSSYGYNLSGAVIEAVTGMRFSDFLASRVFTPLGMRSSRADNGTPLPHEATFYDVIEDGRYKPVFRVDNTIKLPSGGLLASPTDLVHLGEQMIRPTLISTATRDILARPTALADGTTNPQNYALGWRSHEWKLLNDSATTRVLHHNGVALGAVSHFAVYPEEGVVVSLMMNMSQARFGPFGPAADLVDIFLKERNAKRAAAQLTESPPL